MENEVTLYSRIIRGLKNHPVTVFIIIVFIVVISFAKFLDAFNKIENFFKNQTHSEKIELKISSVTPEQIFDSISNNDLPPLQIEEIKKSYIGLRVKWIGYVNNIRNLPSEIYGKGHLVGITLNINRKEYSLRYLFFIVNLNDYPDLKLIKKAQQMEVDGTIENIENFEIQLKDAKIKYNLASSPK